MLFKQGDLRSYILPIFSLAIGNIAYYAMWLRRYMVDESNKDYIRLARAKGLPAAPSPAAICSETPWCRSSSTSPTASSLR